MKTHYTAAITFLAGVALGAIAFPNLHAETKPPAYVVSEVDVMDGALYDKNYVPLAAKAIVAAGGKYIVRGSTSVSLYGVPPKRIAIMQFESLDKATAAFRSPIYKNAKKVGDEYANFRIYALEGVAE